MTIYLPLQFIIILLPLAYNSDSILTARAMDMTGTDALDNLD